MFNSLIILQAARVGNAHAAAKCCLTLNHPRELSDCQACQDVHCIARLGA